MRIIQASLHFTESAIQLLASDTYFARLQTSWSFPPADAAGLTNFSLDEAFLIRTSNEVRVATSFNLGADHLVGLADGVRAKVSDGSFHHRLVFLRRPLFAIFGGELGKVSAHVHESKMTVRCVDE